METINRWIIKIGNGGKPYLLHKDNKYGMFRILEIESENVIFKQDGFEFLQIGRHGRLETFECLYANLDKEQPVSPLDKLDYEYPEKKHSLTFLYEILSGVALRTKPIVKLEALDVDNLLKKYESLSDQLDGVDFHKVVEDLDKQLKGA